MLTAARNELRRLLDGIPCRRPPVLRRALHDGAMLACDLPKAADPEATDAFCRRAVAAGWRAERDGDWILLDRPDLLPFPAIPDLPPDGETGCVLSLLKRHPELWEDLPGRRMMARASETGPDEAERICRALHARWAMLLAGHQETERMGPHAD